ncbi:MAG: hypothetical protein K2Q14_01955 [Gammaproteobacteria bacterium]|nr:hypothetical protein [Gammaproteobacteria bacterium]
MQKVIDNKPSIFVLYEAILEAHWQMLLSDVLIAFLKMPSWRTVLKNSLESNHTINARGQGHS